MLHPELKQKLLEKDQPLADKISGPQKKEPITANDFKWLAAEIDGFVKKRAEADVELKREFWGRPGLAVEKITIPAKQLISDTTLWRYFDYDENYILKNPKHPAYVKNVKFILLFLQVDESAWDYYLNLTVHQSNQFDKLIDCWFVFRFDYDDRPPKVKRSVLRIARNDREELTAQFTTLVNIYKTETIKKKGNILYLTFDTGEKIIDLCISLGNSGLNSRKPHLNGIIRSVGEGPYCKHCILVCANDPDLPGDAWQVTNVCHSSETENEAICGALTDPIVEYLHRKFNWIRARPFEPAALDEIQKRNEHSLGKDNSYAFLKSNLSDYWVSFASIDYLKDQLSLNIYQFIFNDVEKTCRFLCQRLDFHKKEIRITGTVNYKNNWIILGSDHKSPVTFNSIMKGSAKQLFASSVLVDAAGHFVIREILVSTSKSKPLASDCKRLSYAELLSIEHVKHHEKIFLFDKNPSFSEWLALYYRENHFHTLSVYAGQWLVFMPNMYASDYSVLQIALEIDLVGGTKEDSYITIAGKQIRSVFYGHASILGNTLRLSNMENASHKSIYVFDIRNGESVADCLEGLNIDRDARGFTCSDFCIALKYSGRFGNFEPGILSPESDNYKAVDDEVHNKLQENLREHFFVKYPSFRRKNITSQAIEKTLKVR